MAQKQFFLTPSTASIGLQLYPWEGGKFFTTFLTRCQTASLVNHMSCHSLIFRMTIEKASVRMFEFWAESLSPISKPPFLLTNVSPTATPAVGCDKP
jgi:hypothetical protein